MKRRTFLQTVLAGLVSFLPRPFKVKAQTAGGFQRTARALVIRRTKSDTRTMNLVSLRSYDTELIAEVGAQYRASNRQFIKVSSGNPVYAVAAPGMSDDELVRALKQDPDVLFAEPDYPVWSDPNEAKWAVPAADSIVAPSEEAPWYTNSAVYTQIGADVAQQWIAAQNNPSQPAYIAIVDSGIDVDSANLAPHRPSDGVWGRNYRLDAASPDDVKDNPPPAFAHGTAVASQISLAVSADPFIKFWSAKVLNINNLGNTSDVIRAVSDIKQMKVSGTNFVAVNMSLFGFKSIILRDMGVEFGDLDVFWSLIAGNNGGADLDINPDSSALGSYGRWLFNAVSSAATSGVSSVAGLSNIGKATLEMCAPGSGNLGLGVGDALLRISGTSFAAPLVTGAAAELALRRGLSALAIRRHLKHAAIKRTDFAFAVEDGNFLDVGAALTQQPTPAQADELIFEGKAKFFASQGRMTAFGTARGGVFCLTLDGYAIPAPDGSFAYEGFGANPGKLTAYDKEGGRATKKVKVKG